MAWDKSAFLQRVKEEFEDKLNDIKVPDTCYDSEEECWDEEKVKEIDGLDLDEIFDEAVSYIVEREAMRTTDCWTICQDIIGCDNFSMYNDIYDTPRDIHQMAVAALDQLAKEELDLDTILIDWLAELSSPNNNEIEEQLCTQMT